MRITTLLSILLLASCSRESNDLTIGELYFSSLRIGNLYGAADSTIRNAELYLDTARIEMADSSDAEAIRICRRFRDEGFMYKPFLDLRRSDSTYVKLYLDSADYDKIKVYKWRYLLDNKKKVVVRGRTQSLRKLSGDELYYCTEFIEAKLVDGATFPTSDGKMWPVEDYN